MIVAIDFDRTIKRSSQFDLRERNLWRIIVNAFTMAGHKVIVATMRHGTQSDHKEVMEYLEQWPDLSSDVYYCGDFPNKKTAMKHYGIMVDIWID
jgi:hypothetical protein